jgi:chromosome segregation ATPase
VTIQQQTKNVDVKDLYVSQLTREIKELKLNENDYKNISGTLANLEKRYAQVKSEKFQAEQVNSKKIDELIQKLANLRTKNDDYKNRIMEKETECKNISEDIEGAERLLNSKKQTVDQMNFSLDDLITKKSQFETELAQVKNLYSRVSGEREEVYTSIQLGNQRLQELVPKERGLEQDKSDLEAKIEGKKKSINGLNSDIAELERTIDALKTDIEEKDAEANDVEQVIISLSSKIQNERRTRDSERDELELLNTELAKQLNTINDLHVTLQKAQGKLR